MDNPSEAAVAPVGGPIDVRQEREALLEKEKASEGRARAMTSVLELRYNSKSGSSAAGRKSELMRARRQKVTVADFELLKVIGRGAFGEVRLCRERRSSQVYAMKTMSKSILVGQGKVAHVWAERCAMAEAAYQSPWLVQLHHAWCSAEHVYLVMDYLPGGDLMSRACRAACSSFLWHAACCIPAPRAGFFLCTCADSRALSRPPSRFGSQS